MPRRLIVISLFIPFIALAEPVPAPEATKVPPWYSTVTVSGLVDGYYQLRFDAAQDAPLGRRAFDTGTGFQLGYARVSAAMAPAPAGFRIDLGFGPTADVLGVDAGRHVQQAYAAMKFGPVEVNFGRFSTSAGGEVMEAKDDWLYSRSLLFFLEPATHTGVRVVVPIRSMVLTVGVNNGWDVVAPSYSGKTGQLSLAWTGPSATTLAINAYLGQNPTTWDGSANTTGKFRTFVDAVAMTAVGPFALSANFDWGTEAADTWWGGSLMARYTFPKDILRVTARGGFVKDYNGVRLGSTEGYEGTLGVSYPVGSNSELRAEVRYDRSSASVFANGSATGTSDQITGTLAALAWF